MSLTLAADPNTVSIVVGSTRLQGWESVSITRSCETMPNAFAVAASSEFLQASAIAASRPGQACKVYIGSDLVITGWVDRRTISIDKGNHVVTLTGRGITRNLVDCSADLANDPGLRGGMVSAASALDLAQRLSKAYGITVRSAVSSLGPPIPAFQVLLGESPYEVIESVCRYAGFLCYEDENGNLVLDQVNTSQKMASGFSLPGNIEAINATRSVDQRYSEYIVVWYGIDSLADLGNLANRRADVKDAGMNEYRLRIIVSEQIAPPIIPGQPPVDSNWFAVRRANWEMGRRIGRSQAVAITTDSWRDKSGALWTPNRLAPIQAAAADLDGAQWSIGTVTFRKDHAGTHADLVLMPPDAFDPEPNPLMLFDNELVNAPQGAPPASTSQVQSQGTVAPTPPTPPTLPPVSTPGNIYTPGATPLYDSNGNWVGFKQPGSSA